MPLALTGACDIDGTNHLPKSDTLQSTLFSFLNFLFCNLNGQPFPKHKLPHHFPRR